MKTTYDPSIFDPNSSFSVGLELEVRLVKEETFAPSNSSKYIFEHLPSHLKDNVHKELLQSMIEIVTPVSKSAKEAVDFLDMALRDIAKVAKKEGIYLAALATHPFERKEDNEIVHDPRYEAFEQELQIVLKNFLISGLHIHVGMPNEDAAIRCYQAAIKYMPIFIALSANSPFHLGEDTGLQSYRNKIFERLPRAGIPEFFSSYKEYCSLIDQLFITNTIQSVKDVWWDVRIHQKFGTIELRVCDAFFDFERIKLLVQLFRSLMAYAYDRDFKREFYQIYKQNKWNAIRHDLNGNFIEGSNVSTIKEKTISLIEDIQKAGIFKDLFKEKSIEELYNLLEEKVLSQQAREIYNQTKDFTKVIEPHIVKGE
ncbi:MAG: YbdK family carboxylate-amine ligase [Epsilonproteobacteria bacterium]|nr:YbdK family carboxylate-amine ligase [Campylobacterota bacterium]